MKYLLWFYLYVLNNESHPARTYILITRDSITFYTYDFMYVRWKIDERFEEHYQEAHHSYYSNVPATFKGIYAISLKDIRGVAYVTDRWADITISCDNLTQHIQLYKFKKKRLKHLKK